MANPNDSLKPTVPAKRAVKPPTVSKDPLTAAPTPTPSTPPISPEPAAHAGNIPKEKSAAKPVQARARPVKAAPPGSRKNGKTSAAAKRGFTREEVALRAYFIAEKRHQTGAPGDETSDWVEAERQLRAEREGNA
jgi:hypothetical protein